MQTAEELLEKLQRQQAPEDPQILLTRLELAQRAKQSRRVSLCELWKNRPEVVQNLPKYEAQRQAILEMRALYGRQMERAGKLNAAYRDSELRQHIIQFDSCASVAEQITAGLEWFAGLNDYANEFKNIRADSEPNRQVVFRRFDHELGQKCYRGDTAGLMRQCFQQAMARLQTLARAYGQGAPIVEEVAVGQFTGPKVLTNQDCD